TRQTQRGHRRLGARADEANQVDAGERLLDKPGQLDFGFRRRTVARAAGGCVLNGGDNAWVGVTRNQRTPGREVVDVAVVVDVPDRGALGAGDEAWRAANGAKCPDGRVDAARQELLRFSEQRFGLRGRESRV